MKSRCYFLIVLFIVLINSIPLSGEFIRGIDISMQTSQEEGDNYSDGVVYHEYGESKDAFDIFVNHDINWVRIRLFHSPTGSENGVCQDLDYVTSLASRAKSKGFKYLLDIHYSDTWADPAHQYIPNAWAGYTQQELVDAVFSYSHDVITHLQAHGVMPDMVQIGNETRCGMLWPNGNFCNYGNGWSNYVDFVESAFDGIAAACGTLPIPEIMIHIDRGGDKSTSQWFFNELITRGVNFDIIGLSFYPEWHGTLADLQENLQNLAMIFEKEICMAEIGDYYTGNGGSSPESQKEFIEDVIRIVQELPDAKGRGVFYWEPTWVWSSPSGYRAIFVPMGGVWDRVDMLMGMEAFNKNKKYSIYSNTIVGSVSGGIMEGHNSDDKYEMLTELVSVAGNYSYLEHKWVINNVRGDAAFMLEAFKTDNDGDDNFIFSWSVDDINYSDMFAVFKTVDDDSVMSFKLPEGIDGTVYIKVRDSNRSSGSSVRDTIYVDDMYIYVSLVDECGVNKYSVADLFPDCIIDLKDFAIFAQEWLD